MKEKLIIILWWLLRVWWTFGVFHVMSAPLDLVFSIHLKTTGHDINEKENIEAEQFFRLKGTFFLSCFGSERFWFHLQTIIVSEAISSVDIEVWNR